MRPFLKASLIAAALSVFGLGAGTIIASAQDASPSFHTAWQARPVKLPGWTGPNRPIWRLADILAAHKNAQDWSQEIVRDADYTAHYIQMAPGGKTPTQFWSDNRVLFVVEAGQIRFTIEGQQPFVATKGFMVQVPARVPYSMETVGDAPSLRFEVTRTGDYPSYPATADDSTPPKLPGVTYFKTTYSQPSEKYDDANPPFLDFEKDVAPTAKPRVYFGVDKANQFQLLRGSAVPLPPDSNLGHVHFGYGEFWLTMQGQVDYLIEGHKGVFSAMEGDVVYAPAYRWHRATSGGTGMATRFSIVPRSGIMLSYCGTCEGH